MTAVPGAHAHPGGEEPAAGLSTGDRGSVIVPETAAGFPEEDQLVLRARTDRQAFGQLYDRHFNAIYHYIERRVGDAETAEDIASAVWERALTAIERYELRGVPFAAWLYRIAGNLVANHHRQRQLRRFVPLLRTYGQPSGVERLDERSALAGAFRTLSGADQEVIALFYFADLAPPEMATVLDCSLAAVHKRLHRARMRLKTELEKTPNGIERA